MTAVGAAGVALIDAAFPGQEAEAENRARRRCGGWCGGLAAQLAYVDRELQTNRNERESG